LKPKIDGNVIVRLFKGEDEAKIIEYDKLTNLYKIKIGKTIWTRVPYKLPKNFKGPVWIEKIIR
tara:strand:+ start:197 stop:388 length:192 start_codon:yes stop_codon:yes gene_type:complete